MKSLKFDKDTKHISLRGLKITSIEFAQFSNFPFLNSIDLDSNQFDYLSFYGIQECKRLETISASFNKIREVNLESLIKCKKLESLDFTENKLTKIDFSVISGHPNLKRIRLVQNLLTTFDFEPLGRMPKLVSVHLYNNQLDSINLEKLSDCKNLMHLELGNNPLTEIDLTPLRNISSLRVIECTNAKISDIDLSSLSDMKSLERVNFASNRIREIDLSPLVNCRLLKEVILNYNQIQELDISPLLYCPNFQHLGIDDDLALWVPKNYESIKPIPKWIKSLKQEVKVIDTSSSEIKFKKHTRTRRERTFFIDPKEFKGLFLDLVNEINDAFDADCYVCTAFLSRKLLESLVISILQRKFGKKHRTYYLYQDSNGEYRIKAFGKVLAKFWEIFDEHIIQYSHSIKSKKIAKLKNYFEILKNDFDVDVHQLSGFADEEYLLGARKSLMNLLKFLQHIGNQIR